MTWILFLILGWLFAFFMMIFYISCRFDFSSDIVENIGIVGSVFFGLLLIGFCIGLSANIPYNRVICDYEIQLEKMEYQYKHGVKFHENTLDKYLENTSWLKGLQRKNNGIWDWYIPDKVMDIKIVPINELEKYLEGKQDG